MFEFLIKKLKAHPRKIVFTEGHRSPHSGSFRPSAVRYLPDPRSGGQSLMRSRPLPRRSASTSAAPRSLIPPTSPIWTRWSPPWWSCARGKMTEEQCRAALSRANYFGTMLVKMGYADALLGGATYSTADTVRPALQLIKTKPGSKIVSSCFILVRPSATGDREVWPWATAPSTSSPPRTSWLKSLWRLPIPPRSSASIPRLPS